jgi:hypothetical protein
VSRQALALLRWPLLAIVTDCPLSHMAMGRRWCDCCFKVAMEDRFHRILCFGGRGLAA